MMERYVDEKISRKARKIAAFAIICLFIGTNIPSNILTTTIKADDGASSVSVVATGVELPRGWGAYQRKLVRTSDGDLHCVYRRFDGSYFQIWYACSSDGGETWTEEQMTTANHNHYEPAIAVDSNDYIHVVWSWHEEPHWFGRKCTVQYRVKTEEGWQPIEDVITGYGHNPSIAVDSQDNIHLVVGGMNPGGYNTDYVKYLKRTSSGWSSPEMVSSQIWADQPAIAVDGEDNVHVVFYYAPYYEPWRGLKYCKKTAEGWQEEETIELADEERSAPSMALDRYGNVYVVWGNWDTHCISIAKRTSEGWQIDDVWQENGYDQLYPSIAVDSNDYIHVVWQGKYPDSPDCWQIRYRKYTTSWQLVENLTSASVNQSHPYLIWSYYPVINGVHTNIPRNGFAFIWNDDSTIKFYKSDDLEWETPVNQPLWQSSDIGEIRWIEVEDVDGDGINEIVVGTYTGFSSNVHHGYIYVFNAVTHELEWQSDDIGFVNKVVVSDLDGDGKKEIIASVLYSRSGVIGDRYGYIYVFDGVTHNQMWRSGNIGTPRDLVVDDIDGDGIKEIITSGMDYYSCTRHGYVYVFDGVDFTLEWKSGDVNSPYAIVVADVDDDGVKEIVFGNCVTDCASSSSEGGWYYPGYIYVYNGVSFTQEWRSDDIGNPRSIAVDDVDSDGVKEIVAGVARTSEPNTQPDRGYIYVFDGQTHVQEWKSENINYPSVKVSDLDNDGRMEIVARTLTGHAELTGIYQGYIYVFDGETHTLEWRSDNLGCDDVLLVNDIDNEGIKEILVRNVTSGGFICFFDGVTHGRDWQSIDIGVPGIRTGTGGIRVADVDDDGWKEIFAGGSTGEYHGCLYIFEITGGNQPPNIPTSIFQYRADEVTVIPEGEVTPESTVVFKATVSDPDGDLVRLEIELRQIDEAFTGEPTPETISSFVPSGSEVVITRYGLISGDYHWRYRTRDIHGDTSDWEEFGAVGNIDFTVSSLVCIIELQKDGNLIDEINVGEFFDICIIDFSDDIQQVRFLSDEDQNGEVDEGFTWTDWYDWGISKDDWTGHWDAINKIKTWAFATPGEKEVWAEVKDGKGRTAYSHAGIYAVDLPFTIRIYRINTKKVDVVPFDLYTRRVLPREWEISTSPEAALEAGAIAIKMYGWYYNIHPKRSAVYAHLYDSPADQVYDDITYDHLQPPYRDKVNNVVDETWLVGIRKNGKIFPPEYWDGNVKVYGTSFLDIRSSPRIDGNNIIKRIPEGTKLIIVGNGTIFADGWRWWEIVDPADGTYGWTQGHYLQAYTCSGQPCVDDIGVSRMSQEGSVYWAEQGKDFRWILSHFYGDIEFFNIKPPSAKFNVGDRVQTTDPLNVRSEAWIDDNIIWTAPEGSAGTIIAAEPQPQSSQGCTWWRVSYDAGYTGWSSQHRLEKTINLVITSPLTIFGYPYEVGKDIFATFSITNRGNIPITLNELVVGGRISDEVVGEHTGDEIVDFTKVHDITLQPGDTYPYLGTLTLETPGIYHFFCAYYIENPTPEEKALLDENNWNTNIDVEIDGKIVDDPDLAKFYREKDIVVEKLTGPIIYAPKPKLWEEIHGPWEENLDGKNYQIKAIATNPTDAESIYVAVAYAKGLSFSGEIWKLSEGTWQKISDGLSSRYLYGINAIAVAPSDPNIVYVGGNGGVYKHENGVWKSLDGPKQGRWIFKAPVTVLTIDVDSSDSNVVYVGTENSGIWKKSGSKNWEKIREGFNPYWGSKVDVLKVSPDKPGIIYASGYWIEQFDYLQPWGILRSINGGVSWQEKWAKGIITDISIGGKDRETVYVASRSYGVKVPIIGPEDVGIIDIPAFVDGVFRYKGDGEWNDEDNWEDSRGIKGRNPLPQYSPVSIAVNPKFPNMVFTAFRYDGVYYSPNFGNDWYSLGLKDQYIKRIAFTSNGDSSMLYVYTPKNLFRLKLSNTAVIVKPHSPIDIIVWDSQGRSTGLVKGTIKEEIPDSIYDNGSKTVTIFSPSGSYRYEIIGADNGIYGLDITSVENSETTTFTATDIPTTPEEIHQYTINWSALSQGEKGVTIQMDYNGDGIFDKTIITDDTFAPPIANFTCLPDVEYINQPVIFNASNSYDPDGSIVNYTWTFGDGSIGYGKIVEYSYSSSGEYTVTLTVTDDEDTSSSYSKTILIDIIPPTTIKTVGEPKYGSNDEWVTSHTKFNLTATDDFSGVNKTYYRIWYNGIWTEWMEYNGNFTLTDEGKHYLEYYSVDYAGNQEEIHNETHFVDDTPPATTLEFGQPYYTDGVNNWITTSTPIYLNATDYPEYACGVETIYYRVDEGNWQEYIEPFTIKGECQHIIEYYSIDYLGNEEEHHIITVYVDDTPPTTTLEFGTPYYTDGTNEWITSWTTIYLNATDLPSCGSSGVKEIHYNYGDGWNIAQGDRTTFTIPTECNHTIQYYAIDNLGNTETTNTREVKVDNTPPVTTLEFGTPYYSDGPTEWITSWTTIYLNATDYPGCASGVKEIRYSYDNATTWNIVQADNVIFTIPDECKHIIKWYAVDNLGNTEEVHSIEVKVDDTPPVTLLEESEPYYIDDRGIWVTSDTMLHLNASDKPVCGCGVNSSWYKIDNGSWNLYRGRIVILEEGEHILYYYSVDNLGNSEVIKNQTIYVDDTPPTTLIDVEWDTYYTYDPETGRIVEHREIRSVTLTADDGDGVDHCMVYWATRDPFGHLIWHSQPDSVTFKGDVARNIVMFYSMDALGNQEEPQRADRAVPVFH